MEWDIPAPLPLFSLLSSSLLFSLLYDVDHLRDVVVGAELRRADVHVHVVVAAALLAPLREELPCQTLERCKIDISSRVGLLGWY